MKPIIFYIDPQSYNNLSNYDFGVLSNLNKVKSYYICNQKYDYDKPSKAYFKPIFRYVKYKSNIIRGLSYLKSLFTLSFLAFKHRPSVIHVQWMRLERMEMAMYRAFQKLLGTKIVFTMHDIFPRNCSEKIRKRYISFYRKCDTIIVHTQKSKESIVNIVPEIANKCKIVEHGILDLKCNREEADRIAEEWRLKYNLTDKIVFIHVGGQACYKGSDILLNAWMNSKELNQNKNAVLIQAGKNYDLVIPDKIPDNLVLIPRLLSAEEFLAVLKLGSMAVLPYRAIDQSGVILTMINEDVPLCVSKAGELENIFKIGNVGVVIDELSEKGIIATLVDLLKDSEKIRQFKNDTTEWNKLKKHYDWSHISENTEKIYLSLIEKI